MHGKCRRPRVMTGCIDTVFSRSECTGSTSTERLGSCFSVGMSPATHPLGVGISCRSTLCQAARRVRTTLSGALSTSRLDKLRGSCCSAYGSFLGKRLAATGN